MLDTAVQGTTRVAVTVTFLRMDQRPDAASRPLPDDASLIQVLRPTLGFYRYLHAAVGGQHCWWLRRSMPDGALDALLADPAITVHVLYRDGEPAGFFELDRRAGDVVNLAYFGLLPHAIGAGLGTALLHAGIQLAWTADVHAMTVNTCTADHQRALPSYLRAGFRPLRSVREIWDVPNRLGLSIPDHLRV